MKKGSPFPSLCVQEGPNKLGAPETNGGLAGMCRRLECHQCSTLRPAQARRVAVDVDAPTNVLKVSNLVDTLACGPG